MQNISDLKLSLIERIMNTNQLDVLEKVSRTFEIKPDPSSAFTKIRTGVTLDDLLQEQAYQPISYAEYLRQVSDIKWSNGLEEMLEMID